MRVDHRIRSIAAASPRRPAIIAFDDRDREQAITWAGLEQESAARARLLPRHRALAVIALDAPNRVETVVRILACLRAGLPPLPLDPKAPPAERARLLRVAGSGHLVHVWGEDGEPVPVGEPPPEGGRPAGYLLATGGSSGSPRVIALPGYDQRPVPNPLFAATGWRGGQRQLIVGPLHHAAPFSACVEGLLDANTLVLQNVFRPGGAVRIAAEHAVHWIQLTPTHMQWILLAIERETVTLPALRAVVHTAAPCPEAVKRAWIELLGPLRVFEFYAATEGIGTTLVRGDEWLRRPGTVGRGFWTQIRILDERGRVVPTRSAGEIYMRKPGFADAVAARHTADGFSSVGDHGWLDEERYLFLSPRREDLVLIGGANVYPAEVEAVLLEHPQVVDCAVLGIPDDLIGSRLAAYIARRPGAQLDEPGVRSFCAERLSRHKIPQIVHFIEKIPRSEAGKLHRRRLREMTQYEEPR
jgi:bile acid-coenzyme A ligase